MKSTFRIVWSDEALNNLQAIIDYLEFRWTEKEIRNFSKLLDHNIKLILSNPHLFPKSEDFPQFRRLVRSSQTTIYYKIEGDEIHLITLFDNRQNPKKLKHK
ncbi:MAG: type II toxin-antitoxin system RelE/ParE family toxin [Bacteroidales bacterium]|nr:type II toxin-antitoxin system RelE/ParE family toxin [Bacteroidales bacterium]